MIKKIIIATVIIIIAHTLIRIYAIPTVVRPYMNQVNIVKAQELLFDSITPCDNVIVGSSIAHLIVTDSLESFVNLSFSGESSYLGLELLMQRGFYPKRLFIETNVLLKNHDTPLFENVKNKWMNNIKQRIPLLREGREPIPLFEALIEHYIVRKTIPYQLSIENDDKEMLNTPNDENKQLLQEILRINNIKYSCAIDNTAKLKLKTDLTPYLNVFKKNKTEIIFFEVPMHKEITESSNLKSLRSYMYEAFPSQDYGHIPLSNLDDYQTSDVIHLNRESALKYTLYFKTQVDSLISIGK